MRRFVIGMLFVVLGFAPNISIGQQSGEEKYEPVSASEFNVSMKLSGRVSWDKDGLANGGPIDSLSFWGHELVLTSNMIKDGFIHTKDYGKILIRCNPDFSFRMELTQTQQKRLRELRK